MNTPEDVEREIRAQARDGYDLIKFHEIADPAQNLTTTGLTLPAYFTMIEAAREAGISLVGHAPVNLGLDVLLRARQPWRTLARCPTSISCPSLRTGGGFS